MKTNTAKKEAPKMPKQDFALTDPRRKLSREEWKSLTKEQKAERKNNRIKARGPIKGRMTRLVLSYSKRAERMASKFANEKPIADALLEIAKQARLVSSDIDELPDTWMPSGRKPHYSFTAGQRVHMVEAQVAHYEELLGEDIGELEIVSAVGKRVVVKTVKGGVRLFLPAKHIKAQA